MTHFRFSSFVLGILFLSSCATTKITKLQNENKETVRIWFEEGWNKNKNKELVSRCFTTDWEDGNPILPDQVMGHEGMYHLINSYRAAFPDSYFTISHLFAEKNKVVVRYEVSATHKGLFFGIEPTGKKISTTGVLIYEMENGKIKTSWAETDIIGILNQLK